MGSGGGEGEEVCSKEELEEEGVICYGLLWKA